MPIVPNSNNFSPQTPLTPNQGGTGANLSATGPGVLYQASAGAPLTVVTPYASVIAPASVTGILQAIPGGSNCVVEWQINVTTGPASGAVAYYGYQTSTDGSTWGTEKFCEDSFFSPLFSSGNQYARVRAYPMTLSGTSPSPSAWVVSAAAVYVAPSSGTTFSNLLNYKATTDLHVGSTVSSGSWYAVGTAQNFTPAHTGSTIQITTTVSMTFGAVSTSSDYNTAAELLVNGVEYPIGGAVVVTGNFTNETTSQVFITGLTAGTTYTVQLRLYQISGGTAVLYLRPNSYPATEFLKYWIDERY